MVGLVGTLTAAVALSFGLAGTVHQAADPAHQPTGRHSQILADERGPAVVGQ